MGGISRPWFCLSQTPLLWSSKITASPQPCAWPLLSDLCILFVACLEESFKYHPSQSYWELSPAQLMSACSIPFLGCLASGNYLYSAPAPQPRQQCWPPKTHSFCRTYKGPVLLRGKHCSLSVRKPWIMPPIQPKGSSIMQLSMLPKGYSVEIMTLCLPPPLSAYSQGAWSPKKSCTHSRAIHYMATIFIICFLENFHFAHLAHGKMNEWSYNHVWSYIGVQGDLERQAAYSSSLTPTLCAKETQRR